jgi:hypothetical protein
MKEETMEFANTQENFSEKAILSLKEDSFLKSLNIQVSISEYSKSDKYKANLDIKFPKDTIAESSDVYSVIEKVLKNEGLDYSLRGPNFPNLVSYCVFPEFVDGKINWRRFIPYPEKFSEDNKKLLDTISTFVELNDFLREFRGDSLHKFTRLVLKAKVEGLITENEYKNIEAEYYTVAH